jgi:small subunit ribosomal protein S6
LAACLPGVWFEEPPVARIPFTGYTGERVRNYELVLVVSPEVGDEGLPTMVERVNGYITERGGEVKQVDQWGKRRLAYPIARQAEGYYVVTQFSLEPQAVRSLEGNLELTEDLLRHLVTRVEETA